MTIQEFMDNFGILFTGACYVSFWIAGFNTGYLR